MRVARHEVPGIRKRKEPVPEGRCDYVLARYSTKIALVCAKFRDGVDRGSYPIILSLPGLLASINTSSSRLPDLWLRL